MKIIEAIQNLSIHRSTKLVVMYEKKCKIASRFASRSLICDAMNPHQSAVEKKRKSAFFITFFILLRWISIVS